jgi:hypothetical protein
VLHFAALSLTVACVAFSSLSQRYLLAATITGVAGVAACVMASGVSAGLALWCVLLMAVSSVLVLALAPRPKQARVVALVSTLLGVLTLGWLAVAR